MPRLREQILDNHEDIVSYEHHIAGRFVRVLVGFGTALPDGGFLVAESQNYDNFIIQGDAYEDLMAAKGKKPAGVFRKDDLWEYVDIGRAKAKAEADAIAASMAKNNG